MHIEDSGCGLIEDSIQNFLQESEENNENRWRQEGYQTRYLTEEAYGENILVHSITFRCIKKGKICTNTVSEIQRDSCLYRASVRKISHSNVPLYSYAQDANRNACWSAYGVCTYRCLFKIKSDRVDKYWHNSPEWNLLKICPEILNM